MCDVHTYVHLYMDMFIFMVFNEMFINLNMNAHLVDTAVQLPLGWITYGGVATKKGKIN